MKLDRRGTAADNARALMPKMAKKYFAAGQKALHHKTPLEELHPFRIATKRFRYSLELFEPVYGRSLDRFIQALRDLQNALGQISDVMTIRALVRGDTALETKLQRVLERRLKELRAQWAAFDAPGELARWRGYFAGVPASQRVGAARRHQRESAGRPAKGTMLE